MVGHARACGQSLVGSEVRLSRSQAQHHGRSRQVQAAIPLDKVDSRQVSFVAGSSSRGSWEEGGGRGAVFERCRRSARMIRIISVDGVPAQHTHHSPSRAHTHTDSHATRSPKRRPCRSSRVSRRCAARIASYRRPLGAGRRAAVGLGDDRSQRCAAPCSVLPIRQQHPCSMLRPATSAHPQHSSQRAQSRPRAI